MSDVTLLWLWQCWFAGGPLIYTLLVYKSLKIGVLIDRNNKNSKKNFHKSKIFVILQQKTFMNFEVGYAKEKLSQKKVKKKLKL